MIHNCPECGLVHDHVVPPTNPEVEAIRVRAEYDYKIAQLQARSDNHIAEVVAEADVEVAEAQSEAIIEALSSELAEPPAEETEEVAPIAINAPVISSGNDEEVVEQPPPAPEPEDEPEPKKRSGFGMWR